MKKTILILIGTFLIITLSGVSNASTLGINITIFDENSSTQTWHGQGEDEEVEPGMQHGQEWDLEAFFLNSATLSMVGGYDFINGEAGHTAGDIFIDIDNDAVYGDIHGTLNGNRSVNNTFGYDYVLDIDFTNSMNLTYNVYKINETTKVLTSYYQQNQGSNPWRWDSGGNLIQGNISFSYNSHTSYEADFLASNFGGDWHNVVSGLDLSFLGDDIHGAIFHSTMRCGNDNLMGMAPAPEPATMILFGIGLIGIASIGRKKQKK